MQYIFMVLAVLGITAADQFTKYLTVANIEYTVPLTTKPFIPGVISFTHTHNDGAAWSSFSGMQWLFVLIFAIFTVAVVYEMIKKTMNFTNLERWLIVCIYGGGLGNMIDRLRLGYVIDMIKTDFIDFPIFNVADCFISCGCILLVIHLIFFNKKFWKDEKKK